MEIVEWFARKSLKWRVVVSFVILPLAMGGVVIGGMMPNLVKRLGYALMSILLASIIIAWLLIIGFASNNLKSELKGLLAALLPYDGKGGLLYEEYCKHLNILKDWRNESKKWNFVKAAYVIIWTVAFIICVWAEYASLMSQLPVIYLAVVGLVASLLNMSSFYCSCVHVWLVKKLSDSNVKPPIERVPFISVEFRQFVRNEKNGLSIFSCFALAFSLFIFCGLLIAQGTAGMGLMAVSAVAVNTIGLLVSTALFACAKFYLNRIWSNWTDNALSLVKEEYANRATAGRDGRIAWLLDEAERCECMITLATMGDSDHLSNAAMRFVSLLALIVGAASMVFAFVSAFFVQTESNESTR